MGQIIREAGWPVYFVIASSLVSLFLAARWARSPRPGGARVLGASALVVAGCAIMGFLFGLEASLGAIGGIEERLRTLVFLYGFGESLHNVSLAALVLTVDAALYFVGCARLGRASGGASATAMPAGV
jgi:hypothetical protein